MRTIGRHERSVLRERKLSRARENAVVSVRVLRQSQSGADERGRASEGPSSADERSARASEGPSGADGCGRLDCRTRDGESLLCSLAWIGLKQARPGFAICWRIVESWSSLHI